MCVCVCVFVDPSSLMLINMQCDMCHTMGQPTRTPPSFEFTWALQSIMAKQEDQVGSRCLATLCKRKQRGNASEETQSSEKAYDKARHCLAVEEDSCSSWSNFRFPLLICGQVMLYQTGYHCSSSPGESAQPGTG